MSIQLLSAYFFKLQRFGLFENLYCRRWEKVLFGNCVEFCFSTLEKFPYCCVVMKTYYQSAVWGTWNGCLHECPLLVLEAGSRSRWSSSGWLCYEGTKRARGLCLFPFFPIWSRWELLRGSLDIFAAQWEKNNFHLCIGNICFGEHGSSAGFFISLQKHLHSWNQRV